MNDLTLSQAEIEALLSRTSPEPEPADAQNKHALTKLLYSAMLSASGALEMSLGTDVRVEPPRETVDGELDLVGLAVTPVHCTANGLDGHMHLLLSVPHVGTLVNLLRGMESDNDALSDMELMTVGEVMDDIIGELASHLSSVARSELSMERGETFLLEAGEYSGVVEQIKPYLRVTYRLALGAGETQVALEQWVNPPLAQYLETLSQPSPVTPARHSAQPVAAAVEVRKPHLVQLTPGSGKHEASNIDMLLDIPLEVTVELGRTRRSVRHVLAMGPGSVLELEKIAGEAVDVMVNGKLLAKGEVVVIDENFGVRITEIVTQAERVRRLGG